MNSGITKNVVAEAEELLPDAKIIADIEEMLNENIPARLIWEDRGIFPVGGPIHIVLKEIRMWRYDASTAGQFSVGVVVALGDVFIKEHVSGSVEATYGFVQLRYNSDRNITRDDWTRQMWDAYSDEEIENGN